VRAGRRVKQHKPGYCYAKCVPRSFRSLLMQELGVAPTLLEFLEAVKDRPVFHRNLQLRIVGPRRFHVVWKTGNDTRFQMLFFKDMCVRGGIDVRIGAEADVWDANWHHDVSEEYLDCPLHLVGRNATLEIDEPLPCSTPSAVEADLILETESVCRMDNVRVRGSGDCWKKLFWLRSHRAFNGDDDVNIRGFDFSRVRRKTFQVCG